MADAQIVRKLEHVRAKLHAIESDLPMEMSDPGAHRAWSRNPQRPPFPGKWHARRKRVLQEQITGMEAELKKRGVDVPADPFSPEPD